MKDSGIKWIGEIPEDWEVERLQWLLEEIKEMNSPIKTNRVLSLTNKAGVIPYEEKGAQGNVAKEDYTQYKLAYPHTIVANSMNILIGSVGICDFFGCVSPVYYVFRPTAKADLHFINYVLQTTPFQRELRRYANGILEIRLRVSSNGILKRKIAVPCLSMQQKIVTELDKKCADIDKLIANQQGQIEKLKEYKQAIITQAVTKGLNPSAPMKDSGVEWIGEIPEVWRVCRLKNLPDYSLKDAFVDGDWIESPNITNEGIRYLTTGNIGDGIFREQGNSYISEETFKRLNCKYAYPNDLVISRLNSPYGRSCLLPCDEDKYVLAVDIVILRTRNNKKYICYFTQCPKYQHSVEDLARGTAMKRISRSNLGNIVFLCPPIEEQQQIADYLDNKCEHIDKLISIKQAKIEKLNEYKKSLIYEYVTGKKEVV